MNDSKQHRIFGSQLTHTPLRRKGSHKHSIWLALNLFKAAHSNKIINREKISFPRLSPWRKPCCLGRRSGRRWRLSWLPAHTASQRRQVVINTLQITFTGPTWSAWVLLPPGLYFCPPGTQNTLCLTLAYPVWERLTGFYRGCSLFFRDNENLPVLLPVFQLWLDEDTCRSLTILIYFCPAICSFHSFIWAHAVVLTVLLEEQWN